MSAYLKVHPTLFRHPGFVALSSDAARYGFLRVLEAAAFACDPPGQFLTPAYLTAALRDAPHVLDHLDEYLRVGLIVKAASGQLIVPSRGVWRP